MTTIRIDLGNPTEMLLPFGPGLHLPFRGFSPRPYPSNDWWGQLALFRYLDHWKLIRVNDWRPDIQHWSTINTGHLVIEFHGRVPEIITECVGSWQEGADLYREWARKQSWWINSSFNHHFLMTGSTNSPSLFIDQYLDMKENIPDGAVWATNYRNHKFQDMWPDYAVKDDFVPAFEQIENDGRTIFPYMNSMFWDENHPEYDPSEMILKKDGTIAFYAPSPNQKHACLSLESTKQRLVDSRDALGTSGVYLDSVGGIAEICYSSNHDHAPGDPRQYIDNLNDLISRMRGEIIVESITEQTLGLANASLTLERTGIWNRDTLPLFQRIYGDIAPKLGCKFIGDEPIETVREVFAKSLPYGRAYPTGTGRGPEALMYTDPSIREILLQ